VAALDLRQRVALLVEDVERDLGRHMDRDLGIAAALAFLLDRPQDMQRGRFDRPDMAHPLAMGADLHARLDQRQAQALA